VFVALAVAALLAAGFAATALDMGSAEGDFFGALLGVGTLLLLGAAAVFLRVFGFRFFRD